MHPWNTSIPLQEIVGPKVMFAILLQGVALKWRIQILPNDIQKIVENPEQDFRYNMTLDLVSEIT